MLKREQAETRLEEFQHQGRDKARVRAMRKLPARTAEVISKVLLLARDDQIQDASILDQLR